MKTRTGAYGLILQNDSILLTLKTSGPYQSLWDLPGGGLEPSETPLQALCRELSEEVALTPQNPTYLATLSNPTARFHHIGIIYRIPAFTPIPNQQPQDQHRWFPLSHNREEFTTFVRQILAII